MLLEFSMFPVDKGESLSKYVARSIDIIEKSGLPHKIGPMSTTVEGEWDELMAVVRNCYDEMSKDCGRINCSIKIDSRKGKKNQLEEKIRSLEKKLGKKI